MRFDQIVRFATVDAVKAGWLQKHKGNWSVTEEGKAAYSQFQDPETFYKRAVKLYRDWKKGQPEEIAADFLEGETDQGEKKSQITFEQAEEQAWNNIEQYLRSMPPYEFQELVAFLLRAMGYFVPWVAERGKDGGIDIVAWGDELGTRPPRIKVQVKRIGQKVAVDTLRSFMAVLGHDEVGIFVTTSGFTKDAEDLARTQENRKITLIDLERLVELWIANYARLDDAARALLPLKPIHYLAPVLK